MKTAGVRDFVVVAFVLTAFPLTGNAVATGTWRYKGEDGKDIFTSDFLRDVTELKGVRFG